VIISTYLYSIGKKKRPGECSQGNRVLDIQSTQHT
jgi:hypothetical protein